MAGRLRRASLLPETAGARRVVAPVGELDTIAIAPAPSGADEAADLLCKKGTAAGSRSRSRAYDHKDNFEPAERPVAPPPDIEDAPGSWYKYDGLPPEPTAAEQQLSDDELPTSWYKYEAKPVASLSASLEPAPAKAAIRLSDSAPESAEPQEVDAGRPGAAVEPAAEQDAPMSAEPPSEIETVADAHADSASLEAAHDEALAAPPVPERPEEAPTEAVASPLAAAPPDPEPMPLEVPDAPEPPTLASDPERSPEPSDASVGEIATPPLKGADNVEATPSWPAPEPVVHPLASPEDNAHDRLEPRIDAGAEVSDRHHQAELVESSEPDHPGVVEIAAATAAEPVEPTAMEPPAESEVLAPPAAIAAEQAEPTTALDVGVEAPVAEPIQPVASLIEPLDQREPQPAELAAPKGASPDKKAKLARLAALLERMLSAKQSAIQGEDPTVAPSSEIASAAQTVEATDAGAPGSPELSASSLKADTEAEASDPPVPEAQAAPLELASDPPDPAAADDAAEAPVAPVEFVSVKFVSIEPVEPDVLAPLAAAAPEQWEPAPGLDSSAQSATSEPVVTVPIETLSLVAEAQDQAAPPPVPVAASVPEIPTKKAMLGRLASLLERVLSAKPAAPPAAQAPESLPELPLEASAASPSEAPTSPEATAPEIEAPAEPVALEAHTGTVEPSAEETIHAPALEPVGEADAQLDLASPAAATDWPEIAEETSYDEPAADMAMAEPERAAPDELVAAPPEMEAPAEPVEAVTLEAHADAVGPSAEDATRASALESTGEAAPPLDFAAPAAETDWPEIAEETGFGEPATDMATTEPEPAAPDALVAAPPAMDTPASPVEAITSEAHAAALAPPAEETIEDAPREDAADPEATAVEPWVPEPAPEPEPRPAPEATSAATTADPARICEQIGYDEARPSAEATELESADESAAGPFIAEPVEPTQEMAEPASPEPTPEPAAERVVEDFEDELWSQDLPPADIAAPALSLHVSPDDLEPLAGLADEPSLEEPAPELEAPAPVDNEQATRVALVSDLADVIHDVLSTTKFATKASMERRFASDLAAAEAGEPGGTDDPADGLPHPVAIRARLGRTDRALAFASVGLAIAVGYFALSLWRADDAAPPAVPAALARSAPASGEWAERARGMPRESRDGATDATKTLSATSMARGAASADPQRAKSAGPQVPQ